jgi:hypothetical protein
MVQDNGPEPVLRKGVDGRTRYEIRPIEEDETEAIEGVHYRYVVDYNLLVEGEDYDIIERGPYIAAWNLDVPQPTEVELEAAWEAYLEAEANKPPELSEVEQLRAENTALQDRLQDVEVIMAELLSI